MPRAVPERVNLPMPTAVRERETVSWAQALIRDIMGILAAIGQRLNGSLHRDGEVTMNAPFGLASYLTADIPDAADYEGHVIYVSDAAGGANFQGSDGTSWVNLG